MPDHNESLSLSAHVFVGGKTYGALTYTLAESGNPFTVISKHQYDMDDVGIDAVVREFFALDTGNRGRDEDGSFIGSLKHTNPEHCVLRDLLESYLVSNYGSTFHDTEDRIISDLGMSRAKRNYVEATLHMNWIFTTLHILRSVPEDYNILLHFKDHLGTPMFYVAAIYPSRNEQFDGYVIK